MTYHDDELLVAFLADGPHQGRETALAASLAGVRSTPQRPAWLVRMSGGTIGQEPSVLLRLAPILAVAALAGVIGGAILVGALSPNPGPTPTPIVSPSGSAEPTPTEATPEPTPTEPLGLVAYSAGDQLEVGEGDCIEGPTGRLYGCTVVRVYLANTDGTGTHALHPKKVTDESFIAWTRDGSGIFYWDARGLVLAEPDGTVLRRWPSSLCRGDCSGISISPDGTKAVTVLYAQEGGPETSVLAVLDLATNQVKELEATRATNPVMSNLCHTTPGCQGIDTSPNWSPDGTRIAFVRDTMSPERDDFWNAAAIYMVNADGTNLRRVTPAGQYAVGPQWSPDGSRLAFMGIQQVISDDGTTVDQELGDIYTIQPNGQDSRQLTHDGISFSPIWTPAGRVTFTQIVVSGDSEEYSPWIVDADGSNQAELTPSIDALTQAGCLSCVYQFPQHEGNIWLSWQPGP